MLIVPEEVSYIAGIGQAEACKATVGSMGSFMPFPGTPESVGLSKWRDGRCTGGAMNTGKTGRSLA